MKNLYIVYYFIFSLAVFSSDVLAIPLDDLPHDEELLTDTSDSNVLLSNSPQKKANSVSIKKYESQEKSLLSQSMDQDVFLQGIKEESVSPKDKQKHRDGESDFYLFEQEELDAQKPGLEIYQSLAPMLTPEMKKDAKKVWAETADFRDAIDFSTKDSDSEELILQQSSKEMTLLKGKSLEELSNKNLPPALYDKKEPDKAMVRELFDGIYDLLKNALLIIVSVLILGKIISFIVKKVLAGSEKRKKRKARRHSKRRRKKRRQTFA